MKVYLYKGKEYQTLEEIRKESNTCFSDTALTLMNIQEVEKPLTEAEVLKEAKKERAKEVANIKVIVDGMLFDGDEISQTRMARSIVGLNDGESILWVLADNTPTQVSKEQLKQALRLAGEEQTKVWVTPYKKEIKVQEDISTIHL